MSVHARINTVELRDTVGWRTSSQVSGHIEDSEDMSKNLQNTSE